MASTKARSERNNQGVLITGMTGSGKSRMGARIIAPWSRRIIIDPTNSFDAESRASSFQEAQKVLADKWRKPGPFDLACKFGDDEEYAKLFSGMYRVAHATQGQFPALVVVFDEVDKWSSPHQIDKGLSSIIRYGRHYGISWVAICRGDTQTNRDVRMNASEIFAFRQGMLSAEMEKMLKAGNRIRKADGKDPYQDVAMLKEHNDPNPESRSEEGVHFVALPRGFEEWWPSWEALARGSGSV